MTEEADGNRPVRKPKRLARDVPLEEAADLKRRYDAGETLLALLEDFEGSYRILRKVLKSQGIKFRASQPLTPPAPPGMVETYASGKSIAGTGETFGVSRDIARRMLLEAGVTLRPRGRPAGAAGEKAASDDDGDERPHPGRREGG
ncbi:helix-turn-helix domain-containing protein [Amycolatopsis sp. cmx-8-4]|uniref:helix-turn-helix domain-containing protein n=1 Tax=Amycolatopsis sp. cmx-8-4 TaxID=2790947 RepID=UPI00397A97E0